MKSIVFILLTITSASVYARDRMICLAHGGKNIVDMYKAGNYGFSCFGKSNQFPEDGKNTKGLVISWTMGGFHCLLDQD